jgi:hypothetical protein
MVGTRFVSYDIAFVKAHQFGVLEDGKNDFNCSSRYYVVVAYRPTKYSWKQALSVAELIFSWS